jgi:hypothetical protein
MQFTTAAFDNAKDPAGNVAPAFMSANIAAGSPASEAASNARASGFAPAASNAAINGTDPFRLDAIRNGVNPFFAAAFASAPAANSNRVFSKSDNA